MSRFTEFEGIPNTAVAHEGPLTVGSSAVTLLSLLSGGALNANTKYVLIQVETAGIRMTVNGTAPTATKGFPYAALEDALLSRAEADLAKVIRNTGTDGAIQVCQFLQ